MLAGPLRSLYVFMGSVSVALGFIGIFLPVLPTTPFLLLAAFFFSRGSERFHRWLVEHPKLGPPIVQWNRHGVIGRRAKALSTAGIVASVAYVTFFRDVPTWAYLSMIVTLSAVMAFIWSRPESPRT